MSDERAMMAKIERGERLESADEMTAEYRDNLVHLMTMQADSELAGGYGYVSWIQKAPTVEEKHVVAQIVKDELRHAAVMYGLLADLGVDEDRQAFATEVAGLCEKVGLLVPAWKPVWEQLPEEAQIPG